MVVETLVNNDDFPLQWCLVYDDPNTKIPTMYYHNTAFRYSTSFVPWSIFGFEEIVKLQDLKLYEFKTSEKFGIGIKIINPLYVAVYDLEYKADGNGFYLTNNFALNTPEQLKYLLSLNQQHALKYIRLAIQQEIAETTYNLETERHSIWIIKVKDYTTEIVCKYNAIKDEYYIQRGDGKILQTYSSDRVTDKQLLRS